MLRNENLKSEREAFKMEDFWYIWVLPAVGGILWWILSSAMVKAPGQALASKIAKVQQENGGQIAGVPYSKIVAAQDAFNDVILPFMGMWTITSQF